MRIFDFKKTDWDKKFIIAYIVTLILAIILGIVLYKIATFNSYFNNFANSYIYIVFNFKNASLFFSHFLSELFYLYLFFVIAYFTKLKYLNLAFLLIRSLFIVIYTIILCSVGGFGGCMIVILIFIPTSLVSITVCLLLTECCKIIDKKYIFFIPFIMALLISILMLILVNLLFRVVIVIV